MSGHDHRFCSTPNIWKPAHVTAGLTERAALLNRAFWGRGAALTISFAQGSPELQARVAGLAREWPGATQANFEFIFLDPDQDAANANIRIGFEPDQGSWSRLGRFALDAPPGENTMNLGWMTLELPEPEARAVVLHEFGHALGLIHEHMNPFRQIKWNVPVVVADLKRTQGWDDETIEANMFALFEHSELFASDVDPNSIMMYPIPPEWTTDGFTVGFNTELTDTDIRLIREAYGPRSAFGG